MNTDYDKVFSQMDYRLNFSLQNVAKFFAKCCKLRKI
jgi:hypothetical protein